MDDKKVIRLQRWWMETLREITRKEMQREEKRQEKARKKSEAMFGNLDIKKRGDIDELYGYGVITARQREKLIDLFEKGQEPDEMYQAKLDLLHEAYEEAQRIMRDLGQEV